MRRPSRTCSAAAGASSRRGWKQELLDFDVDRPFTPEPRPSRQDAADRQARQSFSRRVVTNGSQSRTRPRGVQLELIGLKATPPLAAIRVGESVEVAAAGRRRADHLRRPEPPAASCWRSLCHRPAPVPTTRALPAFGKLMRASGAYWRGSEKNPQLQRIYGTAWESPGLPGHLRVMLRGGREARPPQAGAPSWTCSRSRPRSAAACRSSTQGSVVTRVMEDYSRRRHEEAGTTDPNTPHLTKEDLFITSGRLEWCQGRHVPSPWNWAGATYSPSR